MLETALDTGSDIAIVGRAGLLTPQISNGILVIYPYEEAQCAAVSDGRGMSISQQPYRLTATAV